MWPDEAQGSSLCYARGASLCSPNVHAHVYPQLLRGNTLIQITQQNKKLSQPLPISYVHLFPDLLEYKIWYLNISLVALSDRRTS